MADWAIEPLAKTHEREAFSCGKEPLDLFLRLHAGQYSRKDIGKTFVATRPGEHVVLGYYTLVASSVEFDHIPVALRKKLPNHTVPVILLGRLAVDSSVQGKGLGGHLVLDSSNRSMKLAAEIGIFGVHTHAIDDEARASYARFGFVSLLDQERHMILPIATIRKGLR